MAHAGGHSYHQLSAVLAGPEFAHPLHHAVVSAGIAPHRCDHMAVWSVLATGRNALAGRSNSFALRFRLMAISLVRGALPRELRSNGSPDRSGHSRVSAV